MKAEMTATGLLLAAFLTGCAASDLRPVDIFPEDMCAHCRMAISDEKFASEIITEDREVHKFDDLACLFKYKAKNSAVKIAAIFVKDFDSGTWIPYDRSTIIEADVATPMGSGKIAFADSRRAHEFAAARPSKNTTFNCGGSCCSSDRRN